MKHLIYNNYNIVVDTIYKKNNQYFFYIQNNKIYIIKYYGNEKELHELFNLTNYLYQKKIFVNTFILNNNNEFYVKKDNYYVVLLKSNEVESKINLYDISKFFNIDTKLESINIINEWSDEIDKLEKELIEYNNEYPIIQNSIDFFIGMGENAIELLSNYEKEIYKNNDSIGHRLNYKLFEDNTINNPFLFVKVNKMYDVSNYIKYNFINNCLDYQELDYILKKCNEYEKIYLYSCLLYPSVYFNIVKEILLKEEKEDKIINIINNIDNYLSLLIYCKSQIKDNSNIKVIDWLK